MRGEVDWLSVRGTALRCAAALRAIVAHRNALLLPQPLGPATSTFRPLGTSNERESTCGGRGTVSGRSDDGNILPPHPRAAPAHLR